MYDEKLLTAFEADLVPLVSAGHLLLGGIDGSPALGALGRVRHLERHLGTSSSTVLQYSSEV